MQTDNSKYTEIMESQAISLIGEAAMQICRNGAEISHGSLRERLGEQLAFARHIADPKLEAGRTQRLPCPFSGQRRPFPHVDNPVSGFPAEQ